MAFPAILWVIVQVIGWLSAAASLIMTLTSDSSMTDDVDEDDTGINKNSNVERIPVIYGTRHIGGVRAFVGASGVNNEYLHIVLALCEGEVDEIEDILVDDVLVYRNGALVGSDLDANVFQTSFVGTTTQAADTELIALFPGEWTSVHQLKGVAYLSMKLLYDASLFTAFPTINAVVRGKKILDVRDSVVKFSNNPALCLYDYLTNNLYGKGLDPGLIDTDSFKVAADFCDTSVEKFELSGEFFPLLTCDVILDTEDTVLNNIQTLVSACRGILSFVNGKHVLIIEKDEVPVFDFNESNILGGWKIEGVKKQDSLNDIEIEYINPDSEWSSDIVTLSSAVFLAEDNDFIMSRSLSATWLTDPYHATDMAELQMKKSRQGIVCTFVASPEALKCVVGDIVTITHTSVGWAAKTFRVVGMQLMPDGLVGLSFREHEPSVYDRDLPLEFVTPPDTNLPDPRFPGVPTDLVLDSGDAHLKLAGDGTIISRIFVEWTAPVNYPYVVGYDVEYKSTEEVDWVPMALVVSTSGTNTFVEPAKDGIIYKVRVRTVGSNDVTSAWVESLAHTVIGKLTPPPDVDSFTVFRQPDGTRQFDWVMSDPPADLAGYRIRFKRSPNQVWEDMTPLHDGILTLTPYETNQLSAGQYTAGIKAVDTSGNESLNAALINSTLGDPRIPAAVFNLNVGNSVAGWNGIKTDCWFSKSDEALLAVDQKTWDDFALDGDTWDDWLIYTRDPATPISYEHPVIDLGGVLPFTPLITVDGNGTLTAEESHSDDGIIYTPWAVAGALVSARFIKVRVTAEQVTDAVTITELIITLSAEVLEETINDLATSTISSPAGDFRVPLNKSYAIVTQVMIALQGVGPGWTWELIDKDPSLGPRLKIYNELNILDDATIDVHVRGV